MTILELVSHGKEMFFIQFLVTSLLLVFVADKDTMRIKRYWKKSLVYYLKHQLFGVLFFTLSFSAMITCLAILPGISDGSIVTGFDQELSKQACIVITLCFAYLVSVFYEKLGG